MHALPASWEHTYIHTYTHTCMYVCMRYLLLENIHTYIHTYIHTHIHVCMRYLLLENIHTYTHTHIHVCMYARVTCFLSTSATSSMGDWSTWGMRHMARSLPPSMLTRQLTSTVSKGMYLRVETYISFGHSTGIPDIYKAAHVDSVEGDVSAVWEGDCVCVMYACMHPWFAYCTCCTRKHTHTHTHTHTHLQRRRENQKARVYIKQGRKIL